MVRAFVQPIAQSISRQLLNYRRKDSGWRMEGNTAEAQEITCPIQIDVRFRSVIYRERLQWDVHCLQNSPECFARRTVADLALPQASSPS